MVKIQYTFKKIDIFLLIFLLIIIATTILCILNPNFGEYFTLSSWFKSESLGNVPIWVAILFVMLVCFLGALIPIPIPYTLPITIFAAIWFSQYGLTAWVFILILVLCATFANTVGDMMDYLIGHGAQYIMNKDDPQVENRWSRIILSKPKAIPGVIVLFGLTPLPDSMLMVPLGIAKYDKKKAFLWMFISRFVMMMIFALAGVFTLELFTGEQEGPFGWVFGIVMLYVLWLIIVIMLRYKPKKKDVHMENEKIEETKETEETEEIDGY